MNLIQVKIHPFFSIEGNFIRNTTAKPMHLLKQIVLILIKA